MFLCKSCKKAYLAYLFWSEFNVRRWGKKTCLLVWKNMFVCVALIWSSDATLFFILTQCFPILGCEPSMETQWGISSGEKKLVHIITRKLLLCKVSCYKKRDHPYTSLFKIWENIKARFKWTYKYSFLHVCLESGTWTKINKSL